MSISINRTSVSKVNGKKIRGRQYPWGVVEVENPKHCDFVKIRSMLITHMQDLQVRTECIANIMHPWEHSNFTIWQIKTDKRYCIYLLV